MSGGSPSLHSESFITALYCVMQALPFLILLTFEGTLRITGIAAHKMLLVAISLFFKEARSTC